MTSKTIQTFTGNKVKYKIIKDGYKTITEEIDIVDNMPTRNTYELEPSSTIYDPELNYTIDTSGDYPPIITFNENVVTPDDIEIETNKYVLSTYGKDYIIINNNNVDNFTRVGNVSISQNGIASNFVIGGGALLTSTFNFGISDYEIVFAFTVNTYPTSDWACFFFSYIDDVFNIAVTSDTHTIHSNSGNGSNTWNASIVGSTVIQLNQEYLVKVVRISGIRYMYLSSDNGETWSEEGSIADTNNYTNCQYYVGRSFSNNVLLGNINLAKTYIKINNSIVWQPTWSKIDNNYKIDGNLFVKNGIVSNGNSSSQIIPYFTPTTDTWEFTTRFYTGSELTSHHNQLLHNWTYNYAMAITRQGTSGTPMSSYINKAWTNGTTSLSANTWYWFRFVCTNRVCKLYLMRYYSSHTECPSINNMTLQCTVTANDSFIGNSITIGVTGDQYWGGQVDLTQTKFIEGDRVWKYQTLYTNTIKNYSIGTPNFEDGKLFGLSTSNYIDLPQAWRSTNNWELVTKIKIKNLSIYADIIHAEYLVAFEFNNSSGYLVSYSWARAAMDNVFQPEVNKDYWIKIQINGTTRTFSISEDGEIYTQVLVQEDTGINPSSNYPIRLSSSSLNSTTNPFTYGEYDLTQSYLKINNELIWKSSEKIGETLPGILNSEYEDQGDQVTLNLYDVQVEDRTLILNNNREVTVQNKKYVQYDGKVNIPDHGLSLYDDTAQSWSKYRIITLNVNDEDTGIYTEGNI